MYAEEFLHLHKVDFSKLIYLKLLFPQIVIANLNYQHGMH